MTQYIHCTVLKSFNFPEQVQMTVLPVEESNENVADTLELSLNVSSQQNIAFNLDRTGTKLKIVSLHKQ